jgi:Ca-activated chloride channel homolog
MRRLFIILVLVGLLLPNVASAQGIEPPITPIPCAIPLEGDTQSQPPFDCTPLPCPYAGSCCPLNEACPRPCDFWPCPGPRPFFQLSIQSLHVNVTVENQVATTHIEQIFRNDNDFTVEGTYLFPLPMDAAVSRFDMWVDGQKIEGKILSADEARRIYDEIVQKMRDPALLEYVGRGAFQANIFPIPAGEKRRVEMEYAQVLTLDNGLIHYRYPFNLAKYSAQLIEQVSVSVKVTSADPVRAVYSPSHTVAVSRDDDRHFSAGYEANNILPDTDFDLFYTVSTENIGVNLLTYRDASTDEGFFLLLAAPSLNVDDAKVVAKDVIIVLDQSGSMEGEKFSQAQNALKYVLNHLNAEDRFNIVAFSTGTRPYAQRLQSASNASEATRWVDSLAAEGGTDINRALLEALDMADSERPTILIFLTDGLATEGVVNTDEIIAGVARAAPSNVRLFDFGVGDDVDTILLDTLAEQNHGASSYVRPGQPIDEVVSGFYSKVSTPVLSDIALDFGEIVTSDLYPNPLPDLFAGTQLVVVGRYRNSGAATIELTGTVNGEPQKFAYPRQRFEDSGGNDFIPRLWATRKIGYLLNQIRLHGENKELIDQIVKLSVRYGIVTPYTSYLVTEPGQEVLSDEGRNAIVEEQYSKAAEATEAPAYGADAVTRSQGQSELAEAEAPAAPAGEAANVVRVIGDHTFLFSEGVWIDTAFDPSKMQTKPVEFASEDYFSLLDARPELAAAFALGPRVIALAADGVAYEVTDTSTPPLVVPPTYTPAPEATPVPNTSSNPNPTTPPPSGRSAPTCPGAFLAVGLVAVPFLRRRKARSS